MINVWLVAGAAGAMVLQDILSTMMVQAEARSQAFQAALLDCLGWGATITTTSISVDALINGTFAQKAWTIGAVTVANFVGTYSGVKLGDRFIGRDRFVRGSKK